MTRRQGGQGGGETLCRTSFRPGEIRRGGKDSLDETSSGSKREGTEDRAGYPRQQQCKKKHLSNNTGKRGEMK